MTQQHCPHCQRLRPVRVLRAGVNNPVPQAVICKVCGKRVDLGAPKKGAKS